MKNYLEKQEERFYQLLEQPRSQDIDCPIYGFSRPNGFTREQYQDELFQKAYLLKYAAAYTYDYENLFAKLINQLNELESDLINRENLNILSIGCGVGLDYVGASRAFKERRVKLNYVGVDVVDWGSKRKKGKKGVTYLQQSIDEIDDKIIQDVDIIIFPRSLTDIPPDSLDNFASRLSKLSLNQEIYILFAHVHSSQSCNSQSGEGCKRINSMWTVLVQNELYSNIVETSYPEVTCGIDYVKFDDVSERCLNNCGNTKCNFIAVKNINRKGYHHILRVFTNV